MLKNNPWDSPVLGAVTLFALLLPFGSTSYQERYGSHAIDKSRRLIKQASDLQSSSADYENLLKALDLYKQAADLSVSDKDARVGWLYVYQELSDAGVISDPKLAHESLEIANDLRHRFNYSLAALIHGLIAAAEQSGNPGSAHYWLDMAERMLGNREKLGHGADATQLYLKGRLLLVRSKISDAIEFFKRAISQESNSLRLHYWLALAYLEAGDRKNFLDVTKSMRLVSNPTEWDGEARRLINKIQPCISDPGQCRIR